jgi:type I restriction enzyme, R subunit
MGGQRIKVVCRYQQFRAANRIVERLRYGETTEARSGVVWHTQGSGKSLTMVFVARLLRASRELSDYKIVLINDRVDLEDQLAETAKLIGGRVNVIESRKALHQDLSTDTSDVNMVMVHKFQLRDEAVPLKVAEALGTYQTIPTAKTFGVVNASERILLMIDEAHRTQGSDLGGNIFEAFPNAARIAFTGTPLITERHGEKKTVKRFGEYIDKKITEHTLLQVIARTNRVKKGKHRGYVVDYIGLTEDLTEALTLYAASDEQEELKQGLKGIASEVPILPRSQRNRARRHRGRQAGF